MTLKELIKLHNAMGKDLIIDGLLYSLQSGRIVVSRTLGFSRDCTDVNLVDADEIESYTFYCCAALKDIEIPPRVTHIGQYAFGFCASLSSLKIPNVTDIGERSFADCYNLKTGLALAQALSLRVV